jgi:hypothetical protein
MEGRRRCGSDENHARALEVRLAAELADLERGLDGAAAARTRELREETMRMSGKVEGIGKFPVSLEQRDAETISEALADAYLESAESSDDQTQVVLLRGLAERAIARLAWFRSLTRGRERYFIRLRAGAAWTCCGSRSASFRERDKSHRLVGILATGGFFVHQCWKKIPWSWDIWRGDRG